MRGILVAEGSHDDPELRVEGGSAVPSVQHLLPLPTLLFELIVICAGLWNDCYSTQKMSGLELGGLILAIIPILSTAAPFLNDTAYIRKRTHKKKLADFYLDLYGEVYRLKNLLEDVVWRLPSLSSNRKYDIIHRQLYLTEQDLLHDPDFRDSIADFFVLAEDHDFFFCQLERMLSSFWELVEDGTVGLSPDELNSRSLYEKMYVGNIPARTSSERFRFGRRKGKRRENLKRIKESRELLGVVIDSYKTSASDDRRNTFLPQGVSFTRLRKMSQKVISCLSSSWECDCHRRHQPYLELSHQPRTPTRLQGCLDFVVSQQDNGLRTQWFELGVKGDEEKPNLVPPLEPFAQLCGQLSASIPLCVIIQGIHEESSTILLERRLTQNPRYSYPMSPVSLRCLLREPQNHIPPNTITRRQLALHFASAMHRVGENPHLGLDWTKENIYFFRLNGTIDFNHQFFPSLIAAAPSTSNRAASSRGPMLFHPHESICALAILLIEITLWEPIENFRQREDMGLESEVDVNTNLKTAKRELYHGRGLAQCYDLTKGAIKACLDARWGDVGTRVTFEDENIQMAFHRDVVQRLERELRLCEDSANYNQEILGYKSEQ
ncbi:hypothetical protein MKZ38_000663 [Zalerion maritima]|uniref:DUF7580 domain-containing protein n=1 Tax=Zalerion maritima TaxID=339359 RepID=A0AAD5RR59_9PEZI|nr:hypothetical protein MKZ38_000663 [Zalerion maritima]